MTVYAWSIPFGGFFFLKFNMNSDRQALPILIVFAEGAWEKIQ